MERPAFQGVTATAAPQIAGAEDPLLDESFWERVRYEHLPYAPVACCIAPSPRHPAGTGPAGKHA